MTFGDIFGHDKPLAILKNALVKDRIPHAFLFYGMEGVGKRAVAAVFAGALVCTGAEAPCNACPSCRKVERQTHPDIATVIPDGQFIKIGAVKELQQQMTFRPREGRRRVFVMPEADRMNAPAANALLKTLEEPSSGNILLLTSSRPHALPLTILSRCQQLRFTPLPNAEVARYLREKAGLAEAPAAVLAASAGGSIGRALAMNREDYLALRDGILEHLAGDEPAAALRRLAFAAHFGTEREEILTRLAILRTCYRDALVLKETAEVRRLVFQDRPETIAAVADRLSGRELLQNITTIEAAAGAIDLNANKSLTLEAMLFKLS
jgi:DNA polymerase-3 subunit delta'